jgi:hypothetical protein
MQTKGTKTMKRNNTLTPRQAQTGGYRPLTNAYELPREKDLLAGALADLRRGRIQHVRVRVRGGLEVWRRGMGK